MTITRSLDSKDFQNVMKLHGSFIYNYFEFMTVMSKEFPEFDPFNDNLEEIAEEPYTKFSGM
jgi:hypothetical protein